MPTPAWVKYLQLHFISHHGTEAVCALNDIHVFGKSAADDLEDQLAMDPTFDPTTRPPLPTDPAAPLPPAPQTEPRPPVEPSGEPVTVGGDASDQLPTATLANITPVEAPLADPQPSSGGLPDQGTGPVSSPGSAGPAPQDVPPSASLPQPPAAAENAAPDQPTQSSTSQQSAPVAEPQASQSSSQPMQPDQGPAPAVLPPTIPATAVTPLGTAAPQPPLKTITLTVEAPVLDHLGAAQTVQTVADGDDAFRAAGRTRHGYSTHVMPPIEHSVSKAQSCEMSTADATY